MSIPRASQDINLDLDKADVELPIWKANFWFTIIVLMQVVDIMDRAAVSAVLPMLKKAFTLTDAQSGLVVSILSLSIAIFAIPAALLADRWSRRKTVSLMVGLWSIATLGTGFAKSVPTLLAARFIVGTGEAGYLPVGYSFISAWFPPKRRGTMIGIFHAATPIGMAVGILLAGHLAQAYGWRACFGILAVPGLILAVLAWFMPDFKTAVKEANKQESKNEPAQAKKAPVTVGSMFGYIFKSPAMFAAFLAFGCGLLSTNALTAWGPTFFSRTYNMDVKHAATAVAIASLLGFMGSPLFGKLGDVFIKRSSKGRIYAAALAGVLFIISILAGLQSALHGGSYMILLISWSLGIIFISGIGPNMGTLTQDLTPTHFRALAAGFIMIFNQLIGGVCGPLITGIVSDRYDLGHALMIVCTISILLVMIFLLISQKYLHRDMIRRNEASQQFEVAHS